MQPVCPKTPEPQRQLLPNAPSEYRVVRVIGQGGMGVVYLAHQESLAREIALKMIRPESAGSASLERRFLGEALVTGDLDHPNIVPVHDVGREASGRMFIAMRLVRGRPWAQLMAPSPDPQADVAPLSLRDHLEILLKVCDAVGFAHSRGIVHRDLKPANVMVGEFGEVLVMDWGLALDVSDRPADQVKTEQRSSASTLAGTPNYMAPELALGQADKVSPLTDVYLLGGILYELLTDTPPHQGGSLKELLAVAGQGLVEEPERRAPGKKISCELSRIAMRALSADPAARHPSTRDFALAIRDYLAHEESSRMVDRAHETLAWMHGGGARPESRYIEYQSALALLAQALELWPNNPAALEIQGSVAARFAEEALDRGEVGLAEAQLGLLESNPCVGPDKLRSIRAAVESQLSRSRRSILAAVAVVLVIAGAVGLFSSTNQRRAATRAQTELDGRFDKLVTDGWEAVRCGDLALLGRIRGQLSGERFRRTPGGTERRGALRIAQAVLCWSRSRWWDLLEVLSGSGAAELNPWIRAGTLAASGLTIDRLEQMVRDTELPREDPATGDRLSQDMARRSILGESIRALAHESALARGDLLAASAIARMLLPFVLDAPAAGAASRSPLAPRTTVVVESRGDVVGTDASTGQTLWRTPLFRGLSVASTTVPVADGSTVVVAENQVVRIDSTSGRVLERGFLDGAGLLAWPDPNDRRKLQVLVLDDRAGGYVRQVALNELKLARPVGDTVDGSMPGSWRAAVALAGELRRRGGCLADGLRASIALDPDNVDLLTLLLGETARSGGAGSRELAGRIVDRTAPLSPRHAVWIGTRLERCGFTAEADRVYSAAADRFLDLSGNPDLNVVQRGNPASFLRDLGEELFTAGKIERALQLVETGRRFSTYMEGDHIFYRRYVAWLESRGQREKALELRARIAESAPAGGFNMVRAGFLLFLNIVFTGLLFLPVLLVAQIAALWSRARTSAIADLKRRGLRTPSERGLAYLTHPLLRLRYHFLGYASAGERLILAVVCFLVLLAACVLVGGLNDFVSITRSSTRIGHGYPGRDDFLRFLERRREEVGPRLTTSELLSEAYRARHDRERTLQALTQALTLYENDSIARNNLAVLDEEAGNLDSARKDYERASVRRRGGAVARFNLARLAKKRPDLERAISEMPHRERLRAHRFGPDAPLWSTCPFTDLPSAAMSAASPTSRILDALGQILTGEFGAVGSLLINLEGSSTGVVVRRTLLWLGALSILTLLFLALVWAPLPVRRMTEPQAAPGESVPIRDPAGPAALVLVPGLRDLFGGRVVLGSLKLAALVICLAVGSTVYFGGPLTALMPVAVPTPGYFAGATLARGFNELVWAGRVALAALVAVLLLENFGRRLRARGL